MANRLTVGEEILRLYLLKMKNDSGLSLKALSDILVNNQIHISYGMLRHYASGTKAISRDTFKQLTIVAIKLNICRDEYLAELYFNNSDSSQTLINMNIDMKSYKRSATRSVARAMRIATSAGFDADEIIQYCKRRLARYQQQSI